MNNQYEKVTPTRRSNRAHLKVDRRESKMPGQATLDRIADEKLTGRYRRTNKNGTSNVCTECFTTKSVNGTCGCI